MEYTKGTWGISRDYPEQGDRVIMAILPNGGSWSIAKLTRMHMEQETEANARLLASCPRMHQALQRVKRDIASLIGWENYTGKDEVDEILAEAEGE